MVLPFENVSRQREDDWLAAALADSLTFGLRKLEHILIVSRQHADASTDPQHLFETLAVRYCVKGSYQRVGDELKVLVRLVDADGGAIVVQESVTDRFTNLLALQDEIAGRFAASFEQTRAVPAPGRTSSLAAYKRLSLARELRLTAHYEDAARQLEIAVRQDDTYADAWALLANSYARLTSPAASDDDARAGFQRKAMAAAERAVALDPESYDAQIALALVFRGLHDIERWRTAALKASELNPRLAEAFVLLGQSYFAAPTWSLGRHRDPALAERYLRKAVHLDPRFGLGHNALVYHLLWAARPDEALRAADDALRVLPDHVDLLRARAMTLIQLERVAEAEEQLALLATERTDSVQDEWALAAIDLLRGRSEPAVSRLSAVIVRGPRPVREVQTALIYCKVGDFAQAAAHLAAGVDAEPGCAAFVAGCPAFAPYRDRPALAAVLTGS
jgi:TolB-like protein